MRRLFAWLAGAAGGVAAYRVLTRRRELPPAPVLDADARAEELRARLAESKAAAEPEPEPAPAGEPDPEERRRRVHERGRSALDDMHRGE